MALLEAVAAELPVLCAETCGYSGPIQRASCGVVIPELFEQSVFESAT